MMRGRRQDTPGDIAVDSRSCMTFDLAISTVVRSHVEC
jgi:hypothetical protein